MISNQAIRSEMLERMQKNVISIQEYLNVLTTMDDELDLHDQIRVVSDGVDKIFDGLRKAQEINDLNTLGSRLDKILE